MKSPHWWRIALIVFGSALAGDALLARAARADVRGCRTLVHLQDFSKFQLCFGYPATAPPGVDCALFDFDANGVVDLRDFAGRTFVLRARISVFPARVLMTYSQRVDFDATVLESSNQSVNWSVRPVPGSEPGESLGTIDANGLYTPPSPLDLRAASEVIVEARSAVAPASEFACVSLFGTLAAPPPVSLVLPGSGDPGGLAMNVTLAMPPLALVLPGVGDPDGLPMNVTLAMPPVALVLPGAGDPDGLPMNVTLAKPPVAVVLPGVGEPDAFPLNTTVANPPVAVDFADSP